MGILTLVIFAAFGLAVTRRLPVRWYLPEWLAAGTTVGLVAGSWLSALLSLLMPYRFSLPLALALLVAAAVTLRPWREREFAPLGFAFPSWGVLSVLTAVGFSYLMYIHMLLPGPDGWYSSGPTWADIAVHMTFVSHFAALNKLDLGFPLFAGAKLSYPFLIDFLSSELYRFGWSMRMSLLVPGLLLILAFAQLFYFLAIRVFKSAAVAIVAPTLFFLNGSAAGIVTFFNDWHAAGFSSSFFQVIAKNYSYDPNSGLNVYNVILSALLPQRSTLMGFPIFCLAAILLYEASKRAEAKKALAFAVGVLAGLLPFAHAHTYLLVMLMLGFFALQESWPKRRMDAVSFQALAVGIILAAPALLWQKAALGPGFSSFHIGWVADPGANLVDFWWRNIGLLLPALVAAPFLPRLERTARLLAATALAAFVALNLFLFQPNAYDNSKLLVYCLLVGDLLLAAGFAALVRRWRWSALTVAPIILAMVIPGILAISAEDQQSYVFLSAGDLAFAAAFREKVPADALVLTADNHNHPVPTLTGRNIVMGYRGWLWTYGIDYRQTELDVAAIYAGGPASDLLIKKYGITDIVVGPDEVQTWNADPSVFEGEYRTVIDQDGYKVFSTLQD